LRKTVQQRTQVRTTAGQHDLALTTLKAQIHLHFWTYFD